MTSSDDTQAVAQGLVDSLVGAGAKIDGVFVFCYRASDDSCGGSIHAPEVALDSMIGMIVGILGKLRNQQAEALSVASPAGITS